MEKENMTTPVTQKTGKDSAKAAAAQKTEKDPVKTSAAQKSAQKKYDEKTKMLSIKYTPVDMADYEKMRVHLEENGLSANQFIKGLIHDYFDPEKKAVLAAEAKADLKNAGQKGTGSGVPGEPEPQAKPESAGAKTHQNAKQNRGVVPEWFD